MDTSGTAKKDVAPMIAIIKGHMPETYQAIQAKAAEVGDVAYELVRRGLRGEANCFYAFEAGRIMGTPFDVADISRDIAQLMVQFSPVRVCIWAQPTKVSDGAH